MHLLVLSYMAKNSTFTYSTSDKETPPVSRVPIDQQWFFADWRHHHAATRLENVRQSNIRRGKKLGVQLSHKHPLRSLAYIEYRDPGDGLTFWLEMIKYCCIKSVNARPHDRVIRPFKNYIATQMACLDHSPPLVTICHYFLLAPPPYVTA